MTTEASPETREARPAADRFPASVGRIERLLARIFGEVPPEVYDVPQLPVRAVAPPRNAISRFGWLYGTIWLFYLLNPIHDAATQPNVALRIYGVFVLVVFALWYVAIFSSIRATRWQLWEVYVRRGWLAIGVLIGLAVLTLPASGPSGLATLVYIISASVMVLPSKQAAILGALLVGVVVLLDAISPHRWNTGSGLIFGMVVSGLAVWGVRQMIARNADLYVAQQQIARLAVAEERARTARDLHDILGHSLTVITVKAELAGRLIQVDPAKAEREINDLERLSREALADVRRTVSGYRSVTLPAELVNARAALDAAGIEAELPTGIDVVPGDRRELFGWVIREGTTNVVRHSGAKHCVVRVSRDKVEIADDGIGPVAPPADGPTGSGLQGLRERIECAGGVLTVGRSDLGGFLLRVTLGRPR